VNEVALPHAEPEARLAATVRGRVQGVGFRYFVLQQAAGLGLRGWVANEPDGSVGLIAEGSRGALEAMLAALHDGPRSAHVERVDSTWSPATGEFDRFGVRSAWHGGD
jgi:acylphosphatase